MLPLPCALAKTTRTRTSLWLEHDALYCTGCAGRPVGGIKYFGSLPLVLHASSPQVGGKFTRLRIYDDKKVLSQRRVGQTETNKATIYTMIGNGGP